MAKNKFQLAWSALTGNKQDRNAFNQAFFQFMGNGYAKYDQSNKTYLEKGYNENPTVFAIINKQTVKTVSVPYAIKEIENKQSYSKLRQLDLATKGLFSLQQQIKRNLLQTKAYNHVAVLNLLLVCGLLWGQKLYHLKLLNQARLPDE